VRAKERGKITFVLLEVCQKKKERETKTAGDAISRAFLKSYQLMLSINEGEGVPCDTHRQRQKEKKHRQPLPAL
jgi:hypothetical protein